MSSVWKIPLLVTFCIIAHLPFLGAELPPSFSRVSDDDVALPTGGEPPLNLPSVEAFFSTPTAVPNVSRQWLEQINASTASAQLLSTLVDVLGDKAGPAFSAAPAQNIDGIIQNVDTALARALPQLKKAVESVSSDDRRAFLGLMDWPDPITGLIKPDISATSQKEKFERMRSFRQRDVLEAANILMASADQAILDLRKILSTGKTWSGRTVKTPHGAFLIGGSGDDTYDEKTLGDVTVVIDLGGHNTYTAPVAAARDNEIRLVIDMGHDLTIHHDPNTVASVASGVFGIGLLYAPEMGRKEIVSGSFSQGCGFGGVGGLFLSGEVHLNADRNVQGVGSFGVGILDVRNGSGSSYVATRNAQGAGFVRGVGLFRHDGDNADIRGGLVQPDPREPLGTVSLCQGVGFGRRAYTGGGVGIATVHGDGLHVQGSYFAQGCGYWHGHGIFELRGNRSTLQARRYALGSGVHYAFGHLEVAGNENRILNWGVGPGYGWDRSWGSFNVHGDSNEIQADWGTGTASIGSFSRGGIFGNGNQLRLPDFGSGGFVFDEPAYSAQIIDGNNNLLESGVSISSASTLIRMRNPWGVAIFNGVRPVEKISLEKPTWPELPSEAPRAREEIDLRGILRSAENKPLDERIPLLLDVSATFGLDQATPHQALESLMALPDAAATALIKNVEPAAVEHLIRLRIVVAAYGAASFEAIASTFSEQSAQKQRTLLTLAARLNPDKSLPLLFENAFSGSEQKTHLTALRSLGSVLNRDTGQEPGVRACLEALAAVLKSPRQQRKNAEQLFSRLRLAEAFGLLSTAVELDGSSRLTFFKAGPNDITEMIGVRGATELLRLVMLDKISAQEKTTTALRRLSYYEERVRNKLRVPLANDDVLETVQTLNVLGQIGNSSDASFVAPYMLAKSGRVREMAAVALGRMGEAGLHELNKLFSSMPTARTTVMAALAHSTAGKSSTLLLKGLEDPNPDVRLQALSVFGALPPVLEADRPALVRRAKKILRDETDPSVQLAVQLLN